MIENAPSLLLVTKTCIAKKKLFTNQERISITSPSPLSRTRTLVIKERLFASLKKLKYNSLK